MKKLIGALVLMLMLSGVAWAETTFYHDNHGNMGSIYTSNSGRFSSYWDTSGNSGTITRFGNNIYIHENPNPRIPQENPFLPENNPYSPQYKHNPYR